MANKTLGDLQTQFYDILREEQDNTAYPLTFANELLNSAQERICAGTVLDMRNEEIIEKMTLPFLDEDLFFETSLDTTLTQNASVGDNVLYASTTGYPSSGAVWINGNIIKYTGITATSFTGCTGVNYPHKSGDSVNRLYSLPDNYLNINRVIYNKNYTLDPVSYDNIFLNLKNNKSSYEYSNVGQNGFIGGGSIKPFYTIVKGQYILPFQINQAGLMLRVQYTPQPTEMTESGDESIIPGIWARRTIPYLAVGEMLYNRGEEDRGIRVLGLGYSMIKEMYSYFGNIGNETLNNQRISTGKDQVLNI